MESRFKSLGFIMATIGFLVVLGAVAVRLFPVSAPTDSPTLLVPEEQLYLGTVVAQPGYKHVLTIRNTSDRRVTINRFISSCTCAETVPEHVVIDPGESCDIELTLELMRFLKLDRFSVIPVTVRITPVVDSVVERPWTLEVDVTRPLVYSLAEEVDFGLVSPDARQVDSRDEKRGFGNRFAYGRLT